MHHCKILILDGGANLHGVCTSLKELEGRVGGVTTTGGEDREAGEGCGDAGDSGEDTGRRRLEAGVGGEEGRGGGL